MTMTVDKVLYTGQARTRVAGTAHPAALTAAWTSIFRPPGAPGNGTNPEQMFAAGWSACLQDRAVRVRYQAHRLPITRRAETR
jgi:organic hydroperoxide reductase OsmC/OhrA